MFLCACQLRYFRYLGYLEEINKIKKEHLVTVATRNKMTVPSTQKQWKVKGAASFDSLVFNSNAPVPSIGDADVLVKCNTLSLMIVILEAKQSKDIEDADDADGA